VNGHEKHKGLPKIVGVAANAGAGCNECCMCLCVCQELLDNKPVCVDGSKIESTNFTYERPQLTIDLLREVGIGGC